MEPTQRWHTPKSAAEHLECSESLLEKHRANGTGPKFYKRGPGKYAAVRYLESDLDDWLNQYAFTCTSQYTAARQT